MAATLLLTKQDVTIKRDFPLFWQLALKFSIVAVVPVMAIAVVYLLYFLPGMQRDVYLQHQIVARSISAQVSTHFSAADREMASLAKLAGTRPADSEFVTDLLDVYASSSNFYEAVYLLDTRGRIRSIGVAENLRALRGNYLSLDFSGREFVRKARESKAAVWSNTYLSAVTGRPAVARVELLGEYLLIGEVALSPLAGLAARAVDGGALSVMLLDGLDQLVAHSTDLYRGQQLNLADLEAVRLARASDFGKQSEMRFDNRALVGSALPIAETNWLVLVVQSKEDANRSIDAVWVRLSLSFVMAVFAAAIAAFWTARGLSRRFQDYVDHADAIAVGACATKLPVTRVREFNHLALSLDRMDDAIRSREAALQAFNSTLEARVDERTDELSRANNELVDTLETLKNAQGELVRSEKLASLGAMVAGVAHELNTPIGNSLMVATTLEQHCYAFQSDVENGTVRRSVIDRFVRDSVMASEMLSRNLHLASELISSFKQVAVDQTSSHRRRFTLDEVVGENLLALQPTLKNTPYQVTADIAPDLWFDSYPGPLGQVLVNLINNAVLHGFEGRTEGRIQIAAEAGEPGWVTLRLSDDGCGIPLADQDRIFDPFFTTKLGQGGSGLGLHIVYNLATKILGGKMTVISTPGAGSVFALHLPLIGPVSAAADGV
jgi:C4-dicarboxylate-specific signal transduction histidine kinase